MWEMLGLIENFDTDSEAMIEKLSDQYRLSDEKEFFDLYRTNNDRRWN